MGARRDRGPTATYPLRSVGRWVTADLHTDLYQSRPEAKRLLDEFFGIS